MLNKKKISKLVHYYVNDDNFFDLCHSFLSQKITQSVFECDIVKYYTNVLPIYACDLLAFVHGIENHNSPIPDERENDKFYLGGREARKLRLENNEMLLYMEKYKAPFIPARNIKLISNISITTNYDNREAMGQIEFINNMFPSIQWRV
jgi:hypothetical protein